MQGCRAGSIGAHPGILSRDSIFSMPSNDVITHNEKGINSWR
jgi:hypothetical protein